MAPWERSFFARDLPIPERGGGEEVGVLEGEREREKTERSVEVERGSATEREPSRLSRTKKIQILTAASPRHKAPFRLVPLDEVLVAT